MTLVTLGLICLMFLYRSTLYPPPNNGPFNYQTDFFHLNTGPVCYSDPQFINKKKLTNFVKY